MQVIPFDSFDEMFEHLRKEREAADARVQPWQAAIKPGDHFQRASGYGFNIYGVVLKEEAPRESDLRHYRFCECYSIACVEGELGDVHVSTIEKILSPHEFQTAKQRGWLP